MKTAVAPLPAEPEPAPLNEMWIEKGTPAFMKTVLALFSGGFATFALLYCVQPMMPLLSKEFAINAAQSSLVLSVSTAMLAFGLLITGAGLWHHFAAGAVIGAGGGQVGVVVHRFLVDADQVGLHCRGHVRCPDHSVGRTRHGYRQ